LTSFTTVNNLYENYAKIVFKLHYILKIKPHFIIIFMFFSTVLPAQEEVVRGDIILTRQDTLTSDTTALSVYSISPDAIDLPIIYSALDTMYIDKVKQKVYLINGAKTTYGDINLEAYYIELDLVTNAVFARGRIDSTRKLVETPRFRDGSEEFESEELTYNFKTKRALVKNIITEQEGGFLHSEITKMHEDGNFHIAGSKYTTCDAEQPHFYVNLKKAKMIPGERIISGPAQLVLEDIPLPLIIPFGYFPVQREAASGIIFPKYGEERNRGYFLKEGGYYFSISDYFDLRITGDIYTNGSWRSTVATNYRKRYNFNGNFSFNYANNVSGHIGLEDYRKSINYSVRWTHSQDAKARPGSRFSASVNMSSSGYDRENSYAVADHVNSTKQSSISYTKTWAGTPFNFSSSFNHSQNTRTNSVTMNLPKMNFGMSRIYPLKFNKSGGSAKWWQQLQIQYSASLDNKINTKDSLLFTSEVWNDMDNGFKHDIPVSLPIRPFNNFSISPQLRYSGVLYTKRMEKRWEDNYYDAATNDTVSKLVEEYVPGFYYGQAFSPSISASYSPQVFGMFTFNPGSRIVAVRHVMKPSVSFSYTPAMEGLSSDMYMTVQKDALGNTVKYSIFEGLIYGTPALPTRSGNISFSLANIIEAKVRTRADTTGAEKKVKVIDNLAFTTSYNIYADSLKWSPMSMVIRTRLLKQIDVSARGSFDFYTINESNKRINTTVWAAERKPFRLTSFNLSLGFDLKRLIDSYFGGGPSSTSGEGNQPDPAQFGIDPRTTGGLESENPVAPATQASSPTIGGLIFDEFGYAEFNMPWTLRVAYNFYYTKSISESVINQNITLNGSITMTRKWAVTYTSGYDFRMKEITMTRIGISRDLHCWEMSFNWIPAGYLKSWDFTIRVKASVLGDLKYERRKDFHDNY